MLTWPNLTWPDLASYSFEAKIWQSIKLCDVYVTWPDLTLYTSEILHIYALGIHLKLYEISRRYRDAFQSYCRETKGRGQKMPPPPGGLTPAPRWGGQILPPLSNSRTDGRRKTGENGKRKLWTRRILGRTTILLKKARGQVSVRSKVKTTGVHLVGFRGQLAQRWSANSTRMRPRLVRQGAILKTLCKGQGQSQVRSPKVICWTG